MTSIMPPHDRMTCGLRFKNDAEVCPRCRAEQIAAEQRNQGLTALEQPATADVANYRAIPHQRETGGAQ